MVTISLRGGKKHRAKTVAGLTYLWGSRANDSMIKRQHTNNYERKMRYNKEEYSTDTGVYCTTRGVKVSFFMPELSISKIINHRFHVYNDKV